MSAGDEPGRRGSQLAPAGPVVHLHVVRRAPLSPAAIITDNKNGY
jgi:hypothetical protein